MLSIPLATKPVMWALCDCNSFYCSCERLFRPDLQDKPVVVLSNNDGCLIALTPEAKALGFKMGDVHFQVERELKKHKVTAFSSNYTLYGDISRRVMETIISVVPGIDQYSIDEAFIPFDEPLALHAAEVGWTLHDRIQQWVGMPVRVGIGPTRTLAKLANWWAKKRSRVLVLQPGSWELEFLLESTQVQDLWGIGRGMAARLAKYGIFTAKQLRDTDLAFARKLLTVVGERTVRELRGEQCIMEDTAPVPRKTLINSRSLGRGVTEKAHLLEALAMHCAIAAERLRQEQLEAASLSIHLQTGHYVENYFSTGQGVRLIAPTNLTGVFIAAARQALERCYQPGHKYMKAGVMLYDLKDEGAQRQMTFAEACISRAEKQQRKAMRAMDKVNDKFGRDAVHYLAQGPADAAWHMTRNKMSGKYTTEWTDILEIST